MRRSQLNGHELNVLALNAHGYSVSLVGGALVETSLDVAVGIARGGVGNAYADASPSLELTRVATVEGNLSTEIEGSGPIVAARSIAGTTPIDVAPAAEVLAIRALSGDATVAAAPIAINLATAMGLSGTVTMELDAPAGALGTVFGISGASLIESLPIGALVQIYALSGEVEAFVEPELMMENWSLRRSPAARTFASIVEVREFVAVPEVRTFFVQPKLTWGAVSSPAYREEELRLGHIQKGPTDVLDWDIHLGRWLTEGDRIALAEPIVSDTTVTVSRIECSALSLKVWLSGGAVGDDGWLKIKIDTVEGRTVTVAMKLKVRDY